MSNKKIYIYGGGTFVHVRPHFSISAVAYGSASSKLNVMLSKMVREFPLDHFEVIHVPTKMANTDSSIETNDDVLEHVNLTLKDPETVCIVMSCAICDFKAESLSFYQYEDYDIGKQYPILESSESFGLQLYPSINIIQHIKKTRPDVKLVSFKTTSGEYIECLSKKTLQNMKDTGSDIVFGNDIKNKFNAICTPNNSFIAYPCRYTALGELSKLIIYDLTRG